MQKHIYLIRHGETASNRRQLHQDLTPPLSVRGHAQAEAVAKAVTMLPADVLVSSDVIRAKQTAETIGKAIGKEVVYEPLFRELTRASSLVGTHFLSLASIRVFLLSYLHAGNSAWHYGDEENYSELRNRAEHALARLAEYNGAHIVVVSHRIFIAGILASINSGASQSIGKFVLKSLWYAYLSNCSITELIYDTENPQKPWKIVRINDTRHLAGIQ